MKTLIVFPMIVVLLITTLIGCSGKNQNANIGGVVGATLWRFCICTYKG